VANRNARDFGWEIAHGAVTRRPPISLYTVVPRTGGYTHDVGVCDLSIIQGPFSVAPCQTLAKVSQLPLAGFARARGRLNEPMQSHALRFLSPHPCDFSRHRHLQESRRLESRAKAEARLVLDVSAGWGEPILSRPVGWRRSAALHHRRCISYHRRRRAAVGR
jgi:hypothetical protein